MKPIMYLGKKEKLSVTHKGAEYDFRAGLVTEVPDDLAAKAVIEIIPIGARDKKHPRNLKKIKKYVEETFNSDVKYDSKKNAYYVEQPSKLFREATPAELKKSQAKLAEMEANKKSLTEENKELKAKIAKLEKGGN